VSDSAEVPERAHQWVLASVPGAVGITRAQRLYGGAIEVADECAVGSLPAARLHS